MIATQLPLVFTALSPPSPDTRPWIDLSGQAEGLGFAGPVWVSLALADALEPNPNEADDDYDQRLYDLLWLAQFQAALEGGSSTFTFSFPRTHRLTSAISETSLRLRVEDHRQAIRIGLLADF